MKFNDKWTIYINHMTFFMFLNNLYASSKGQHKSESISTFTKVILVNSNLNYGLKIFSHHDDRFQSCTCINY